MASSEKVRKLMVFREMRDNKRGYYNHIVRVRSDVHLIVSLAASATRKCSELSHSPPSYRSSPPAQDGRGC